MTQIAGGTTKCGWGAGRCLGTVLAVVALLTAGLVARADDAGPAARVVRLSYVQGQVQISQGPQAISSQAAANMPLFEGYQITTGQDGQAEIQFEDGSVARIAPDSGLTLKVLRGKGSSGEAEIDLTGGLGYFELQGGDQAGRIDVHFANAVVTAGGFTVMRVDMDTPPGSLAVLSGNAHLVQGDQVTLDLHGNESVALNAKDPSQYNLAENVESNSWDQWNSDRDQALEAQATTQTKATDSFVNSDNPAWNDLNANGNWYNVPGSGYVWSPYDAAYAGWDPYGYGQWMWTPGFGYAWVSGYPWGFMPYSCGMWNFYSSFGWGWSPGISGCNPWWGGGYGYGYGPGYGGGYIGPNIGNAPSGYHPVVRPPMLLHPPKGRFPTPIVVDRLPKHGFTGRTIRPVNGPVMIAGHQVEALKPMPARTSLVQPARGVVAGGATNRAIMTGNEPRVMPGAMGRNPREEGYAPPSRPGEGFQRGIQPQPIYRSAPGRTNSGLRGYSPPVMHGGSSRGEFNGGMRPSGGTYAGGGFHGAMPAGGGVYNAGGAGANRGGGGVYNGGGAYHGAGGGVRGGGGYSGGGGFHGGAPAGNAGGGGGGGFHGGGGGGGGAPAGGGGGGGGAHGGGGGGGGGGHR
ncbi:MAG TPA: FecR family protein [Terracidiphilus sp.]|nr:FecR family protein [Terracidiphilus sp.]